jgi:predicted ABC-type ATPase
VVGHSIAGSPLKPTLVIVAGPNGSGKSTFYSNFLRDGYPLFINADDLGRGLQDISEELRSLRAAEMATEQRERLLAQGQTFAFETVFSRTDYWLPFIQDALAAGYRVELFFICTEDPALNAVRVKTRVEAGGHPVPADKIQKRYPRSIETALAVKALVDEPWLYDNTQPGQGPLLLGRFLRGKATDIGASIPRWALRFFIRDAPEVE